jgi:hypothetical protein
LFSINVEKYCPGGRNPDVFWGIKELKDWSLQADRAISTCMGKDAYMISSFALVHTTVNCTQGTSVNTPFFPSLVSPIRDVQGNLLCKVMGVSG